MTVFTRPQLGLIKETSKMTGLQANFNLFDGFNVLRIICGAFFIPHIVGKFFEPAALGFFVTAKFKPPKFWMYVACFIEIILAVGLIIGVYTVYVAIASAVHLFVASIAVYRVSGGKWLWNIGGAEYPVFWALSCVAVALHG